MLLGNPLADCLLLHHPLPRCCITCCVSSCPCSLCLCLCRPPPRSARRWGWWRRCSYAQHPACPVSIMEQSKHSWH
jgi:hypothetical protein